MDIHAIEQTYLAPLKEQGYFVTIFGEGSEENTLIIDCSMYFTDTDEGGGPAKPFCYEKGGPCRNEMNQCVACEQVQEEYTQTHWRNGSVMCPMCAAWTVPWSLRQRSFRAVFKLVPGGSAEIQEKPPSYKDEWTSKWMTNAEMIEVITSALALASKALYSDVPGQQQMSDANTGSPKAATSSGSGGSPKAATSSGSGGSPKAATSSGSGSGGSPKAQETGEAFPLTENRAWAENLIQTLCAFSRKKRSD
jgi:hypothetical protein